jgi:hypothetical protein
LITDLLAHLETGILLSSNISLFLFYDSSKDIFLEKKMAFERPISRFEKSGLKSMESSSA